MFEENTVFQFRGAAFVTEFGNELGAFRKNVAVKGEKASDLFLLPERVAVFDLGFEGNGYWIQSSNVEYSDNIAASCSGDAYKIFLNDAEFTA